MAYTNQYPAGPRFVVDATVDPPSLTTTTHGTATGTVTGARKTKTKKVEVFAPSLDANLIITGAQVTANDTVTIAFYNPSGGTVNDSSQTMTIAIFE